MPVISGNQLYHSYKRVGLQSAILIMSFKDRVARHSGMDAGMTVTLVIMRIAGLQFINTNRAELNKESSSALIIKAH